MTTYATLAEKAMATHSCSCLENPGTGSLVRCRLWGLTESDTTKATQQQQQHAILAEKAMATHSSVLAWRIPGTGEPGGLPSMGSHRVGHD